MRAVDALMSTKLDSVELLGRIVAVEEMDCHLAMRKSSVRLVAARKKLKASKREFMKDLRRYYEIRGHTKPER